MVNPESLHDDEWRTGWKADSDEKFYDLVLCIAVLEHLYDVEHALKEIT